MKKHKNPYVGFNLSQLHFAENNLYVIQIGDDLFNNKGQISFSKKSTALFYNKILDAILAEIQDSAGKEKKKAISRLSKLRILPLRIH